MPPKHPIPPDWLPLRDFAAQQKVSRVWLAGLVAGMGLKTRLGPNNAALIREADVPRINNKIERYTTMNRG